MPNLMGNGKAIAPQHRRVVFRVRSVDQHKFFLDPDRTENVRLAAQHRPVQGLVQIVKTKLQCEMIDGDVIDRHRQLDRLADLSSYSASSNFASFSISSSVKNPTLIAIRLHPHLHFQNHVTRTCRIISP